MFKLHCLFCARGDAFEKMTLVKAEPFVAGYCGEECIRRQLEYWRKEFARAIPKFEWDDELILVVSEPE